MPITNNTTAQKFLYQKNSIHATNTFGLRNPELYNSYPRYPFEYYIRINLNSVGTAQEYINSFYTTPIWEQVHPLVKTVELPSIKIETEAKNQYNRKRISQSKINFEPVKMVFHDVADGKTLKFWDMYYRYYFADGNEPGMNAARAPGSVSDEQNGDEGTITTQTIRRRNTSNAGNKRDLQNIVGNTLDNHLFGYNLHDVANIRNLIASIDIFQVHSGRFNQTTLVNPRVSAFNHDTLNYAESAKSLEVTFVFEYEYAYYTIQNLVLDGKETNNESSLEPFMHSEHLEIPSTTFTATLNNFMESNNPIMSPDSTPTSPVRNLQDSLGSLAQLYPAFEDISRVRTSVLDRLVTMGRTIQSEATGDLSLRRTMANVMTQAEHLTQRRNFNSAAAGRSSDSMYKGLA